MNERRPLTVFAILGAVALSAVFSACAEPESVSSPPDETGSTLVSVADGAAIYADRCAVCHGDDGSGGRGPALADGRMVSRYEDINDQIRIVRRGLGEMPAYADRLTDDEIAAVVEYTRTELVSDG